MFAPLRRLLAGLLLLAGGMPTLVESTSHVEVLQATQADHVEGKATVHHADHCLASLAASLWSSNVVATPGLTIRIPMAEPVLAFKTVVVRSDLHHTPQSRAPPTRVS